MNCSNSALVVEPAEGAEIPGPVERRAGTGGVVKVTTPLLIA